MRQESFHCRWEHGGSSWLQLGARFAAPSLGWDRRVGAVAGQLVFILLLRDPREERRLQQLVCVAEVQIKKKISDCKTIQSLLARFSKMLQWYLNKWSVQRMNHLMWKRSFPNLIFYRHFYKTLKTVFQYHASGAMLRKHQQKCSSDSCWVVLVLLKAMGCVLRISQSQSYSRFTTQQQGLGILFVAYVQFGCTL